MSTHLSTAENPWVSVPIPVPEPPPLIIINRKCSKVKLLNLNKKNLLASAAAVSAMLFFMSTGGNAVSKDAPSRAPRFQIENSDGKLSYGDTDGRYTLLKFWNPTDAASRIENRQISAALKSGELKNIRYAGICTDNDASLMASTEKADNLDPKSQYMLSEAPDAGNIMADYSLSTGNHTFLISPDGRIAAVNPTVGEIKRITAS